MAITQIKRQNVSELVFDQMKEMIASGEWAPGSKIESENELSAQFGVSRVTVRSAIQKLSSLGLVESRHGEGTYVCKLDGSQAFNSMIPMIVLSSQDREALHELRVIVEVGSSRIAAERITEEQVRELRATVEAMQEHEADPEAAAADDMAFHKGIARATGNPYIQQIFEIIETNFARYLVENVHHIGASSGVYYHGKICDALESRNPDLAEQLMLEHLNVTRETMRNSLGNKE